MHHIAFIKSIKIQVSYSPHFCLRKAKWPGVFSTNPLAFTTLELISRKGC